MDDIVGLTPEEVWEGLAQIERGEGVPHAEAFRRLREDRERIIREMRAAIDRAVKGAPPTPR